MQWNQFLMKVLLKKKFVGPMNNARDPLEKHKNHINTLFQKKKKKNSDINAGLIISIQTNT